MAGNLFRGLVTAFVRESFRAAHSAAKEAERQNKVSYLFGRAQDAEGKTQEIEERVAELKSILANALKIDDATFFESLKVSDDFKPFRVPPELCIKLIPPNPDYHLSKVKKLGFFAKFIPGLRRAYEQELQAARQQDEAANVAYQNQLQNRAQEIRRLQDLYDQGKKLFLFKQLQLKREVQEFRDTYKGGDVQSIIAYTAQVLERSEYPEGFPQQFRIAFIPDSKELVLEYQLPTVDIVPPVSGYRYLKSKDEVAEKHRTLNDIKKIYRDIVTSVCLRTIQEIFYADRAGHIKVIVFTGFVQAANSSTGELGYYNLISVRTTREKFTTIDFDRVEKTACLRSLGALISRRPEEPQAVKSIVGFNLIDQKLVR